MSGKANAPALFSGSQLAPMITTADQNASQMPVNKVSLAWALVPAPS
jgi:hypothetical protein